MTAAHVSTEPSTRSNQLAPLALEEIRFYNAAGASSSDVRDVLSDRPAVSIPGLALLFANPASELEFVLDSFWRDIELRRTFHPWPLTTDAEPADLRSAFADAVGRAMGDSPCLAVSFSGGLDSLALLHTVATHPDRQGRRVLAVLSDLVDDLGARAGAGAAKLIDALGIDCELVIVDQDAKPIGQPKWSWLGPRGDAMPDVNARLSEEVQSRGADRMMVGSGADELLHVCSFLGLELARHGRRRALPRYLRDIQVYSGMLGQAREVAALASARIPFARSFALVTGLLFPGVHKVVPDGVLSPELERYVHARHAAWLEQERLLFEAHDYDWPAYSAFHAVCPRPLISDATEQPTYTPFLDSQFVQVAQRVRLDRRYDETLRSAYHRMKALVVSLLPDGCHAALPQRKQTFGRAIGRYADLRVADGYPRCVQTGLLRDSWRAHGRDEMGSLGLTALAVEQWLEGAARRGAAVDGIVV